MNESIRRKRAAAVRSEDTQREDVPYVAAPRKGTLLDALSGTHG